MFERQPQIYKRPKSLTSTESLLLLGCLSFVLFVSSAYATSINAGQMTTYTTQGESNKIAVVLSQGCITALKHQLKTGCPTYLDLAVADNTNHGYFGRWTTDMSGFVFRGKTLAPNYYNIVHENHWVVAVDPTEQYIEGQNTKTIIVQAPGTLTSFAGSNENVGSNHTRIEYHDRYVDSVCQTARIAYSPALYLDTISYLESGCTTTTYKDHDLKVTPNYKIVLSPYSSVNLDNYLKTIMHQHQYFSSVNRTNAGGLGPSDCIHHQCSYTDPYKKVGY